MSTGLRCDRVGLDFAKGQGEGCGEPGGAGGIEGGFTAKRIAQGGERDANAFDSAARADPGNG